MSVNVDANAKLGVTYLGDGRSRFLVWAPFARKVDVHLVTPRDRVSPLESDGRGYHSAVISDAGPGSTYYYRIEGEGEYPDPASRLQPEGVHGPSAVVNKDFAWEDNCLMSVPIEKYIIYELHVGAFTMEGTFDAVIPRLDDLVRMGITAVELMPVAQFPGARNWGYDGAFPFAVQDSYGGPNGLKRLVNACHMKGLAVVLDVVYNHIGPEGNYLGKFGPYFTDRYRTPWGGALNFDGPYSDEVRRFFIENALYWLSEFHFDALRLDALHAIMDCLPRTFLEELVDAVGHLRDQLGQRKYLIGESDANDRRLVLARERGGCGLDAQWNEDFHHSLHVQLTGEQTGYYMDFGPLSQLAKAFREGFVYSWEYSPFRGRRHGSPSGDIPARRFVVFSQNHDQVGNRALGERLTKLVTFEDLKLAAGAVLLSPFIPLIFMGEEYGETAPFQYFTSLSDPALVEAVRQGRRREFAAFDWKGELPDPQDEASFLRCKLRHSLRDEGWHGVLQEFYSRLIHLRRQTSALASLSKETLEVICREDLALLYVRRWCEGSQALAIYNFGDVRASATLSVPKGRWRKELHSSEPQWLGAGSPAPNEFDSTGQVALAIGPKSFVLYVSCAGR